MRPTRPPHPCLNPLCTRRAPRGVRYCCYRCWQHTLGRNSGGTIEHTPECDGREKAQR